MPYNIILYNILMLLNIPTCYISESRDYKHFSWPSMREVNMQLEFGISHITFLVTEVLISAQH